MIIDYVPYTLLSIPVAYLFCHGKFVRLYPLHPFCPSLHSSLPMATTSLFSVLMNLFLFHLFLVSIYHIPQISIHCSFIFIQFSVFFDLP